MSHTSTCNVITGTGPSRVRCLERDPHHQGAHWRNVERVPERCRCKGRCSCFDDSRFSEAAEAVETDAGA